ncbi:aminotransferase class I/II-fold pyridoxal phosphate-dependent enzyme [Euzebya tangerina]|uniref:aminotransferase class I/II-fold pyridoxal phosphate-dependent enzyme n=1 Tax=Euzebya tangerina TaxID=591198 RepID=UPI000E3171F7|nr:aminotransferase class I/II-fold pyridoxal phosphate-dependent enzyme [Euzebya tangerina]
MSHDDGPTPGASTRSVHATEEVDQATGSVTAPIIANSAFAYPDVPTWRAAAVGERPGHIYARNSNPTTDRLERKVAALEGADAATSFGTGMAAISTTLLALLRPGQRVIATADCYGGTYLLFDQILPSWGVECRIVPTTDRAVELAVEDGCELLYLETPTNPTLKVLDLRRLAAAARAQDALTVVDNTFATPVNTRPLELGADVVLHSASKFLGGHGDVLGGLACGSTALVQRIYGLREIIGTGMDPQVAALFLRSLKTLALRVRQQNTTALEIAQHLSTHPAVEEVRYPGLPAHPGHAVAAAQMDGFGGVLSFSVVGGMAAVETVCANLRYAYLAANLGQVETIAGPPATTSHVELTEAERATAGIPEGLIRYSVGVEDADDLIADLDAALALV